MYVSKPSETKSIIFDGETDLDPVSNLAVTDHNNHSVSLIWKYSKMVDGFVVDIEIWPTGSVPYPQVPSRFSKETKILIDNLAPGVYYAFKVRISLTV